MFKRVMVPLHLMQSTLYSRHELVTTPLGIDASIPALPLVRVHQLYLFEHIYERGEKDMSNANSVHQKQIGNKIQIGMHYSLRLASFLHLKLHS